MIKIDNLWLILKAYDIGNGFALLCLHVATRFTMSPTHSSNICNRAMKTPASAMGKTLMYTTSNPLPVSSMYPDRCPCIGFLVPCHVIQQLNGWLATTYVPRMFWQSISGVDLYVLRWFENQKCHYNHKVNYILKDGRCLPKRLSTIYPVETRGDYQCPFSFQPEANTGCGISLHACRPPRRGIADK